MPDASNTLERSSSSEKQHPDRTWRWARAALTGVFLARELVFLCVIPPFEMWDEYQHFAYVHHLDAVGERPLFRESHVADEVLQGVVRFPAPAFAVDQLEQVGVLSYEDYWANRSDISFVPPESPVPLYEAQHGPLAYWLMVPSMRLAGGPDAPAEAVAALRLFGIAVGGLTVWIILGCFGRILSSFRYAALAGLILVSHPTFGLGFARVANDPLGMVFATAGIVLLLEAPRRPGIVRGLLTGSLLGVAILCKALHWMLVPFASFPLLAVLRRSDSGRSGAAFLMLGATVLSLVVVLAPQIATSMRSHGFPIEAGDMINASTEGVSVHQMLETALSIDWVHFCSFYWTRESLWVGGWSGVRAPGFFYNVYQQTIVLALAGWFVALARRALKLSAGPSVFREPTLPAACAFLGFLAQLAMAYHTVVMASLGGFAGTNIFYAAATFPWMLLLVHQGLLYLPLGRLREALPWLFAALLATAGVRGVLRMVSYYSLLPGTRGIERLIELQPNGLGIPTLLIAASAYALLLVAFLAFYLRLPPTTEGDGRSTRSG